jgi:hypothetical protein
MLNFNCRVLGFIQINRNVLIRTKKLSEFKKHSAQNNNILLFCYCQSLYLFQINSKMIFLTINYLNSKNIQCKNNSILLYLNCQVLYLIGFWW